MKRSKPLTLISLVLSLLMLFSSCNKSENILKNVLDENAYPADPMPKYTTLAEAPHELSIARHDLTHGNLMLFKSGKYKQFIYNISNNTIVWSETQTQELTINVTLGNIYLELDEISYFVVQSSMLDYENLDAPEKVTTTLYSATGEKIASAEDAKDVLKICDLLYFDGKCYRVTKDGNITYAFDYSIFANIPSRVEKYKDIYYELNDKNLVIYDNELKRLVTHPIPNYVKNDGKVTCLVPLQNGNIFLQYVYKADIYTDDYTYISNDIKYIQVTQIVDTKKGTVKKVNCEYMFIEAENMIQQEAHKDGINTQKLPVYGVAYRIENKRLAERCSVTVNNKGKITELGTINGDKIKEIQFFADNRWLLSCEEGFYLVDENGSLIGEISNYNNILTYGRFFFSPTNGIIYDTSLKKIYDYRANKQTIKRQVGNSLLLEDSEGKLLLYTGIGDPIVLIDNPTEKKYVSSPNHYGYIPIQTGETLEIYNDSGILLGTVQGEITDTIQAASLLLLKISNSSGDISYYRIG